ncbi:hypothetical protein ACFXHA_09870 [Nocardia sp. NPDC059240]|uniref:hypothetical protein n=1 Tax=Nocardia sp. NPDC059240 TaxID=3346786 RepID=UPI0036AB5CAC
MGGVDQGPLAYPRWDLPPIPVLDEPHAVFVAQADTAGRIGDTVVRQMLRRPHARAYFGGLWVAAAAVLLAFNGITGAVQAVFVIGISPVAILAVRRQRVRSFTANAANFSGPGMTLAAKFGPDAMDIVSAQGYSRFRYADLRAFFADRPDVVILHHGPILTGYPRELFPDWAIELIRAGMRGESPVGSHRLPALSELPGTPQPSAVFVATADTAPQMAETYTRAILRTGTIAMAIVVGAVLLVGAIMLSPLLLVIGAVLAAIFGSLLLVTATAGKRRLQASFVLAMPPGQLLATQFGAQAFDIHTATGFVRHRYSAVRSLRFHGPAVMLSAGLLMPYPRELFPADMIAAIPTAAARTSPGR